MKPNYRNPQLTEQYVEMIKNVPISETAEKYGKAHFDQMESESHVMEWRGFDYLGFKYLRETAGIIGFTFMYLLGSFLKDGWENLIPAWDVYYAMSLISSLFIGFVFWGGLAGFIYDYRFGDEKIALRWHRDESELSYKIVRGIGWFGVIFCIVMALIFSPMIFVGAGASALLAFRAINMRLEYHYQIIPYDSILYLQVNEKLGEITVFFKGITLQENDIKLKIFEKVTTADFYFNDRPIDEVIAIINEKVGYDVDVLYTESKKSDKNIEDSRSIYQKIRDQNPPLEVIEFDLRELKQNASA
ncbi:hypothetical protein L4C36_17540 [Photobacterium japonica]|uniref:hypothetical protein n=1 Tax=Photobacterium japonica TaxID=2910235 RepID=UPI003D0EB8F6